MAYSINPASLGSMFAVPTVVLEKIKMASPSQIKTFLWVFGHMGEPINPAAISKEIKYDEGDVSDALTVLCEWGVLTSDGMAIAPMPSPVTASPDVQAPKELPELAPVKPNYEQVAARCKESPEIANMFTDIQQLLGRTIGYDSECILLMIHDQYGLPVEVIYMLVSYCVSVGKGNFAYISKVGKTWGENEIDTIEKADEQIKILNQCTNLWKEFAQLAGIQNPRPTSSQSAYLKTWSVEMKFSLDMIYLAYEETVNHSGKISFAYMNKVLSNWHQKGLKNPDDIEKEKQNFREKNQKPTASTATSYDMSEFNRRAEKLPVYKKGV